MALEFIGAMNFTSPFKYINVLNTYHIENLEIERVHCMCYIRFHKSRDLLLLSL